MAPKAGFLCILSLSGKQRKYEDYRFKTAKNAS